MSGWKGGGRKGGGQERTHASEREKERDRERRGRGRVKREHGGGRGRETENGGKREEQPGKVSFRAREYGN